MNYLKMSKCSCDYSLRFFKIKNNNMKLHSLSFPRTLTYTIFLKLKNEQFHFITLKIKMIKIRTYSY
jgi:hypothetical protein